MGFEKGNSLGGRTKGANDKTNIEVRKLFTLILEANVDQIQEDLEMIKKPETRIKLLLDLAKFCLPTLKSVEATYEGKDVNIINLGNGVNPEITPVSINFTHRADE